MNFFSQIRFVVQGFLARKGRSFLTILGIVIGVAGVIIIISLGAGAQSLVLSEITKIGSNLVGILPGKSNDNGPPAALYGIQITTLVPDDAQALRDKNRFPHIVAVAGAVTGSATVIWGNQSVDTNFTGTQSSVMKIRDITLATGRFFDEREENSNVVVLGFDVKEGLFGNSDPLGQVVKVKNVPMSVIGVLTKQGASAFQNMDDMVYLPLAIAQQQILGVKHLQAMNLKVDDTANLQSTIADIEQVLRERHNIKNPTNDDFTVGNLADAVKILTQVTDALRLFLTVMAGISLIVGGIGIMNIMLVTVAERTREIGLRKAVGATNSVIRNQFLLESGTITLFGGLLGIIVGITISYLAAVGARLAGFNWEFVISPLSVILAVGVSIMVGVIFGLYPAVKASKLDPIVALRYE
jgi:putative ABC transport system permease protein